MDTEIKSFFFSSSPLLNLHFLFTFFSISRENTICEMEVCFPTWVWWWQRSRRRHCGKAVISIEEIFKYCVVPKDAFNFLRGLLGTLGILRVAAVVGFKEELNPFFWKALTVVLHRTNLTHCGRICKFCSKSNCSSFLERWNWFCNTVQL